MLMGLEIEQLIQVPTGHILIVKGEKGKLECLSLGDYGKDVNLNQNKKVEHQSLLPLTKKWVCTISTQYGCSMGCRFCDVPKVGAGVNATYKDLLGQVETVLSLHPEIESTERLNIHFARMGEPTWNRDVLHATLAFLIYFRDALIHPVVSTMMPKWNKELQSFLDVWMWIKNEYYKGNAGLQLSINSTSETEREHMFNGNAHTLEDIGKIVGDFVPVGRKITLNFAVANYTVDPQVLLRYFDPERFIVKLTPMHKTASALKNGIKTDGDYTEPYPYQELQKKLEDAGYDVLVFIASREEDESRITCGNAILSGTKPFGSAIGCEQ